MKVDDSEVIDDAAAETTVEEGISVTEDSTVEAEVGVEDSQESTEAEGSADADKTEATSSDETEGKK